MNNTCKKCGCEDPIPSAPCPTSVGCPTPSKCEETFSTTCLTYTGDDLVCGDTTIVHTDDPVNTVLESIVNAVCDIKNNNSFTVDIADSPGTPGLICTYSTTPAVVTFKWSIEQGPFVGHTINGSDTLVYVQLDPIVGNGLRVGTLSGITDTLYVSHIKLVVTNGLGNTVTKYFTYAKTA
jgi:hypothetical protein